MGMQNDVKETFLIATCVLLGFLVILSLFSKDPYPDELCSKGSQSFWIDGRG